MLDFLGLEKPSDHTPIGLLANSVRDLRTRNYFRRKSRPRNQRHAGQSVERQMLTRRYCAAPGTTWMVCSQVSTSLVTAHK